MAGRFSVAVGTILRFDDVRGYGFIEPADGSEDVFVHANDFGDSRHMVRAGLRVQYEVAQSDRGPKVASISIIGSPPESRRNASTLPYPVAVAIPQAEDDVEVCDVLSAKAFGSEITELLIEHVPTLTGAQIGDIRHRFAEFARSRGWVDG
jgi:CspA family cold shock protein